ncbi:MAG: hypothetical protein R3B99_19990 [Polyangiales bacterium]
MTRVYLAQCDHSVEYMAFGGTNVNLPWWDDLGKGVSVAARWREMPLELEPGEYSDSPTVWPGTIVFSRRSWVVMQSVVGPLGEAFELHGPAEDYVLFNPLVCDLVLSEEADVRRFEDGRVKYVLKSVVRRDSTSNLVIGKAREYPLAEIYVGPPFVDAWSRGGFVGLAFAPVPTAET